MTSPISPPSEIYIPPNCISLDKATVDQQIRLGLQGAPGAGKTWSALTFPNPIVLNLDRGLGAHVGRPEVIDVPIYDGVFCDKLVKREVPIHPPNRKDASLKWLQSEALRLTEKQTLVVDGLTNLDTAFETQFNLSPPVTQTGAYDKFAIWRERLSYYSNFFDSLNTLRCHVILIVHETADRDSKGELNGKLRPLLQGQFADKIVGKFTDFFRCHVFQKPKTPEQFQKARDFFGVDDGTLKEWGAKTKNEAMYLWQTVSDDKFNAKASSLVNSPKWVYAEYDTFLKYRRK